MQFIKPSTCLLKSFLSAAGVFVYVSAVAWLGFNSQMIFGAAKKSFLAPLFILLLFVVSASITGLLVLGKPILLYLEGLKKEAFTLLGATLAWLVIFLSALVAALLLR